MEGLNDILKSFEAVGKSQEQIDKLMAKLPEKQRNIFHNFNNEISEHIKNMDMDGVTRVFNDMTNFVETLKNDSNAGNKH